VGSQWFVRRVGQNVDRRSFTGTEAYRVAELPSQRHRQAVVVAVHVRDQEPADVGYPPSERRERLVQSLARGVDTPSGVDQYQAAIISQYVRVHRAKADVRQR
jgi:hypothetical protein